jgi:hypothetical protein
MKWFLGFVLAICLLCQTAYAMEFHGQLGLRCGKDGMGTSVSFLPSWGPYVFKAIRIKQLRRGPSSVVIRDQFNQQSVLYSGPLHVGDVIMLRKRNILWRGYCSPNHMDGIVVEMGFE